MKIYLSPSAQPYNSYATGGVSEQQICNKIAAAAKVALERNGYTVKKAPEGQSYQKNVAESNAWGADLHIPIHSNAGGGDGTVVFSHPASTQNKYVKSVYAAVAAFSPGNDDGIRAHSGLYEINQSKCTCVYVEVEFHDNANLARWIINNTTELGETIARGVCDADGKKFKPDTGEKPTEPEGQWYRVRKSWDDPKSQTGAYKILENAKNHCPVGYFVFDETGKIIYTPKIGMQAKELKGLSSAQVIKKVGALFTEDQKKSGILASVSLAQFILESGWGKSGLIQKANNGFGMKKNLSGNTWENSVWDGKSIVTMSTGEELPGGEHIKIMADFRAYPDIEHSIADHSAYLCYAKNGSKLRYAGVQGEKDFNKAVKIIKTGGYATASDYEKTLIRLINEWNLTNYDIKETDVSSKPAAEVPFKVKVESKVLRIRTGPGTNYPSRGYTGVGIFTITEKQGDWGKLKSGAGWICLNLSCVHKLPE